ncbi:MAG TPA: hypothetical protein VI365_24615, partial [Trebonia sp.]
MADSNGSGDSSSDGERPRDRASGGGTASGGSSSGRARDPRLAMFARGCRDDRAKPNAWQAMVISDVTGPEGDCPEATDDELVG